MNHTMSNLDVLLLEGWRAIRSLLRRPAYLVLASLTLALGVAATAAAFSLLDLAILRPLPFTQSERLVQLGLRWTDSGVSAAPILYAPARTLPEAESVGIVRKGTGPVNIADGTESLVARSLLADRHFFTTLAVRLPLGRNFNDSEDRPGGTPAVILSHDFWSQRLGGDPALLNRTLQIEGQPVRVIGVLPRDFQWTSAFDLVVPMQLPADSRDSGFNETIVVRLREGVAPEQIDAKIDGLMHAAITAMRGQIGRDGFEFLNGQRYGTQPLRDLLQTGSGTSLRLLFGAALCVLLIATLNLTNLTVVRGLSRSHDHAVRTALGAPTARVALPALAEGLLIGVIGSLLGAAGAWLLLEFLAAFVPPEWLRGARASFTALGATFAFVAGTSIGVLAAAVGVWNGRANTALQELVGGGRSGWSRRASGLGRALVIAQVSVAVTLLFGAALITRNLLQLAAVPMGFESRSILTFTLSPLSGIYRDIGAVEQQTQRVLTRLRAIPGVTASAASTNLPTASQLNLPLRIGDEPISVQVRPITAGFLETFRLSLRGGRAFSAQDAAGAEPVCIVSTAFVAQYVDGDALGQIIRLPAGTSTSQLIAMRVVGVVSDVRQFGPAAPPPPIVYVPFAQLPTELWSLVRKFLALSYAVRVGGPLEGYEARVRSALREIEPLQPIANMQSMQAVVASTTSQQRLTLLLIGLFAGAALLLAGVGLYAVMTVTVSAREHEFGVRAAMGAQPRALLRMVLLESGRQLIMGLLIGLMIALGGARVIRSLLFGVDAADPLAILAVLLVLLVAGLLASLSPAWRASRTHPMQVLRAQ